MLRFASGIETVFGRPEFQQQISYLQELFGPSNRVAKSGWFPHRTTPFDQLDLSSDISSQLDRYYLERWPEAAKQFLAPLSGYHLDAEAHEVIAEAIADHENGRYRSVVRLIFPEIERLARINFAPNKLRGLSGVRELRDPVGHLIPKDLARHPYIYESWKLMKTIAYLEVRGASVPVALVESPIPNRHAALHGWIPYGSHANSLNAIILLDMIFLLIGEDTFRELILPAAA